MTVAHVDRVEEVLVHGQTVELRVLALQHDLARAVPVQPPDDHGAAAAQKHAKKRIKSLDMNGEGKVRINQAGCLDRCEEGPCLVVYPEGTWYTYVDTSDIDEIIDSHLIGGKPVDRLKI